MSCFSLYFVLEDYCCLCNLSPSFSFCNSYLSFVVADTVGKEEIVAVIEAVGADVGTSIGAFERASVGVFVGAIVVGVLLGNFVWNLVWGERCIGRWCSNHIFI